MIIGISILLGIFVTGNPVRAKVITWRLNDAFPPGGYNSKVNEFFCEKVKELSNGQMEILFYPGSSLGFKYPDVLDVVKNKLVETSTCYPSVVYTSEPILGVADYPFLFPNYDSQRYWYDKVCMPRIKPMLENKWNTKVLAINANASPSRFWTKEPINSMDDLKKLKMRVWCPMHVKALNSLGIKTYYIDTAEVYTAIQQGMISAVGTGIGSAVEWHLDEILKYGTSVKDAIANWWIIVNLDSFSALDSDLQNALVEAGRLTGWYSVELSRKTQYENMKKLMDGGLIFHKVPDETIKEMHGVVEGRWYELAKAAGPEATRLLSDTIEFLKISAWE
jgi:TRAP-type C4-dicarboxylate transport system substrate-binding protein